MYQESRVYTPQISRQAGFVLRRIAWGLGTPCIHRFIPDTHSGNKRTVIPA